MRMMKAFAYLGDGTAGWVEKPIPQPTGFDGVIRPPWSPRVHRMSTMSRSTVSSPAVFWGMRAWGRSSRWARA